MHIDSDMIQDWRHAWFIGTIMLGFAVELSVAGAIVIAIFKKLFSKKPLGPSNGTGSQS